MGMKYGIKTSDSITFLYSILITGSKKPYKIQKKKETVKYINK